MVKPFLEEHITSIESIRTFFPDTQSDELKWHYDEEDRLVNFLNENDWKFQLDNQLPIKCQGTVFIEAGSWHRVIKGTTELRVKIIKSVKR